MKKQLFTLLTIGSVSGSLFAQLPVSTSPQNKKVILEEFTGIFCTYCPDGHKKADQIAAANPGNAFVINIHTGSYANAASTGDQDFKTPYNSLIAGQSGITGYPAGTVNRHFFSSTVSQNATNGTSMSRGNFSNSSNIILGQPSYLNVALQGTINPNTRILTVNVEVYYTGNSPKSTNFFNLALLQDSVLGKQTGGSTWYPAMMVGTQYQHNKLLRHFLTGQWGDTIKTTTAGYKYTKQYAYYIPTQLPLVPSSGSGPGAVKTNVLLSKLRIIGYVTETKQEVVSGNQGPVLISVPSGTVTTGVSAYDPSEEYDLSLYPNPSSGSVVLTLLLNKNQNVSIKMLDMMGKEVYNYNSYLSYGTHSININGADLPNGIYFTKVKVGNNEQTEKLLIQK